MRHFSTTSELAVSGSAATNTFPIGFISGSGRTFQIYEFNAACDNTPVDSTVVFEINGITGGTLTPGTGITPTPLDSGNSAPAAVTGASQAPTNGGTLSPANPFHRVVFNTRVTVRWAAIDPDSVISFPAGGGAAGSCLITNRQPGTTGSLTMQNTVFHKE